MQGVISITGQISASELQRWELQISEVGTNNFRSIMPQPSTSQVPTGGTILYEWDTTTVQNGAYILRLVAFSNVNGGFIIRDRRVNVVNLESTPLPSSPTPFVIQTIAPLPFDLLTATPENRVTIDPFSLRATQLIIEATNTAAVPLTQAAVNILPTTTDDFFVRATQLVVDATNTASTPTTINDFSVRATQLVVDATSTAEVAMMTSFRETATAFGHTATSFYETQTAVAGTPEP